jgi:hypothetical protein
MNEIQNLLEHPNKIEVKESQTLINYHYYGNRVRQLFFVAAAIMLIGLPFVRNTLVIPTFFSVVSILLLDFLAGMANPKQLWVNWVNAIIAAFAMFIFELFAVRAFESQTPFFLVTNQALALLFLVALYFNTKTLRSMLMK